MSKADEKPTSSMCVLSPRNSTDFGYDEGIDSETEEELHKQNDDPYWQTNLNTVEKRIAHLYLNECLSDVSFQVKGADDGMVTFKAHRFVLAIASPVFYAMFYGHLKTESNEILIPDIEAVAFKNLLRYLYTNRVRLNAENVMNTLYAAKKYDIPALEQICISFLKNNLRSDNAFLILNQAILFSVHELINFCFELIDRHTNDALMSDYFCDLNRETLITFLNRNTLKVSEIQLFDAVVRWANKECKRKGLASTPENLRFVLGKEILHLIRIPLMSVEEFAEGPAQSGVLDVDEIIQLFLYYTLKDKPNIPFSSLKRSCPSKREYVANRFLKVHARWGYCSNNSDGVKFRVNKNVVVTALGLYGSIYGADSYNVTIELIQSPYHSLCLTESKLVCDGTDRPFRVFFKEPIEIQANQTYIARARLVGPDSYYGSKGLSEVHVNLENNETVTFYFTHADGFTNGTSVGDGQIAEIVFEV